MEVCGTHLPKAGMLSVKTIDLHGVRHKDVSDVLCRCCSEYDIPFVVITGKSSQMKRIVSAVVEQFALSMTESLGNSGRVIVDEGR